MPKVSVIILTKNRPEKLKLALASVHRQTFQDYEIVVVNDGSTDNTAEVLKDLKIQNLKIINHPTSLGITKSRQEALEQSSGELIAFLDDDDEWIDQDKLKKQVEWFAKHDQGVLCGGGIGLEARGEGLEARLRPQTDPEIRKSMLLRNNFFTSTVMFKKQQALSAGGFVFEVVDWVEDYDLWLRMGNLGEMGNFREVFTKYTQGSYNKDKFRKFLQKQRRLVAKHKADYPGFWLANIILKIRILLGK